MRLSEGAEFQQLPVKLQNTHNQKRENGIILLPSEAAFHYCNSQKQKKIGFSR